MKINEKQFASVQDGEKCFSIPDASVRFGLDSFSVYALIQSDELLARRADGGEYVIPEIEIERVLQHPKGK